MSRHVHRKVRPPLLAVLAELYASVEERDVGNVDRLCEQEARRLPREVREEAMAVARTPIDGHRALIRLVVFWRQMRALEAAELAAAASDQLELDLDARRRRRRPRERRGGLPIDPYGPRRRREDRDARRPGETGES